MHFPEQRCSRLFLSLDLVRFAEAHIFVSTIAKEARAEIASCILLGFLPVAIFLPLVLPQVHSAC